MYSSLRVRSCRKALQTLQQVKSKSVKPAGHLFLADCHSHSFRASATPAGPNRGAGARPHPATTPAGNRHAACKKNNLLILANAAWHAYSGFVRSSRSTCTSSNVCSVQDVLCLVRQHCTRCRTRCAVLMLLNFAALSLARLVSAAVLRSVSNSRVDALLHLVYTQQRPGLVPVCSAESPRTS